MIDESFQSLSDIMLSATVIDGELIDTVDGVRSYIYEMEVETPIELDISVDELGSVTIGTIPPMYRVDTTFRPSYHAMRIKVTASDQ